MKGTHSTMKKRPLVSRMSPRVRGKTPLCRAVMRRPPQQKRFFPGNTSHLLRGLLGPSLPSGGGGGGLVVGAGVGRARGSICSYSQLSMPEFGSVPVRTSGACARHQTPASRRRRGHPAERRRDSFSHANKPSRN